MILSTMSERELRRTGFPLRLMMPDTFGKDFLFPAKMGVIAYRAILSESQRAIPDSHG